MLRLIWLIACISAESYVPKYIEGNPLWGTVVDIAPPDLRKEQLFRIQHTVQKRLKILPV